MLHRIRTVRSPALSRGFGGRRPSIVSKLFQRAANAQVAGQESVGIAQRAHGDVLAGPGADTGERKQQTTRVIARGAGIEDELATRERRHQSL